MSVNLQELFQLQQGVHVLCRPHEITSIDSGLKMIDFLLQLVNHPFTRTNTPPACLHDVTQQLSKMVLDIRKLISCEVPLWTDNLQKDDKLKIQIFARLCLIKVGKQWEGVYSGQESDSSLRKYVDEIITLLNQLKMENGHFDIFECLTTMMGSISYIECTGFNELMGDIFEHFELSKEYLIYLHPQAQRHSQHPTPPKYHEREDLMKDLKTSQKHVRGKEGKMTTSTKLTTVRTPVLSMSLEFQKPRMALERTLFHTHSQKYTFKRRPNGYY